MKKIIYGVVSFFLVNSLAAFAAPAACNNAQNLQDLQAQIVELRAEVRALKHKPCRATKRPCRSPIPCNFNHPRMLANPCLNRSSQSCEGTDDPPEAGFNDISNESDEFYRLWGSPRNLTLLAALGATVTTSPFLGLRSAFDASDLIVNLPTMNEDLRFLKEHVLLQKKLRCHGLKLPDRPIIELGGKIEGIAFFQDNWNNGPGTSDINLSSTRLDVLVEASRAVHGFMALNMDNSTFDLLNNDNLDIQLSGAGSRVFNSRVYVSRAFVTIGDLDVTPFYFTIGQMFVPFGRYASNMVTSTLTVALARTNERALLLGYYKKGLYASIYAFRGESNVNAPGINSGGVNLGYEKTWAGKGSMNIGAGYIGNIADATGFQITGASRGFFGFGLNPFTEILANRVPAYDLHGEFAFGKFGLFAEYIATTDGFNVNDLSFDGHGAQPSASNLELSYSFKFADCPASLAAGYGTTSQALVLGLPKSSFTTVFNISIWKNTIESIEFRHDENYAASDFANGRSPDTDVFYAAGGDRNTVTLQVGLYF